MRPVTREARKGNFLVSRKSKKIEKSKILKKKKNSDQSHLQLGRLPPKPASQASPATGYRSLWDFRGLGQFEGAARLRYRACVVLGTLRVRS